MKGAGFNANNRTDPSVLHGYFCRGGDAETQRVKHLAFVRRQRLRQVQKLAGSSSRVKGKKRKKCLATKAVDDAI